MEATYSSVPQIINHKNDTLFSVISVLTVTLSVVFIILQAYRYRNNRNLRLFQQLADN